MASVPFAVCIHNGTVYRSGSAMSTSSLCSYCYCIGGRQKCVKPKCLLPTDGCKPILIDTSCCPIRYDCSGNGTIKAQYRFKQHRRRNENLHYLRMTSRMQRSRGMYGVCRLISVKRRIYSISIFPLNSQVVWWTRRFIQKDTSCQRIKRIRARYAIALAAANGAHRKSAHQSYETADPSFPRDSAVRPATIAVSNAHVNLSTMYSIQMRNSKILVNFEAIHSQPFTFHFWCVDFYMTMFTVHGIQAFDSKCSNSFTEFIFRAKNRMFFQNNRTGIWNACLSRIVRNIFLLVFCCVCAFAARDE